MRRLLAVGLLCLLPLLLKAQLLDTLWTRTYGGTASDEGQAIALAPDGGFLAVGNTASSPPGGRVFAVRTDSNGTLLWNRTYSHGNEYAYAVDAVPGGGWIVAGQTYSYEPGPTYWGDGYLLRLNDQGDTLWSRPYGGDAQDWFWAVVSAPGGGFLATGSTTSFGPDAPSRLSLYLVRVNAQGDTLWTRAWGRIGNSIGWDVAAVGTDGFVVAGITYSDSTTGQEAWLLRLTDTGDTLWTRTYTGIPAGAHSSTSAISVAVLPDEDFVLAGGTEGPLNDDTCRVFLVRTDSTGQPRWQCILGRPHLDLYAECVVPAPGDGFYVVGQARPPLISGDVRDLFLLRTDGNGDTLWWQTLNMSIDDSPYGAVATADGGVAIVGRTVRQPGFGDQLWLVRYEGEAVPISDPPVVLPSDVNLLAYPNPFNSTTEIRYAVPRSSHVSLKVFDVTGREVCCLVDGMANAGERRIVWEAGGVASGVYFVRVAAGETGVTRKVMLVK